LSFIGYYIDILHTFLFLLKPIPFLFKIPSILLRGLGNIDDENGGEEKTKNKKRA